MGATTRGQGSSSRPGRGKYKVYLTLIVIEAKHYCSHLSTTRTTDAPPNYKTLKALDISHIYLLAQPAHGHDEHGGRCVFAYGASK